MDNVHKLTGNPLPGEPNLDLAEALEDLAKRARRGEIQALAWAGYTTREDDSIFSGWDGSGGTSFHLCAAIRLLDTRYNDYLLEQGE